MKIAVTGGTGFLGRNIARALVAEGHQVVIFSRGNDLTDRTICQLPGIHYFRSGLDTVESLEQAFAGCAAVAHCAGINRECGEQTFRRVHLEGTRNVVAAAVRAKVRKITLISFLRARPDCGSPYHESKWAAEEIVRDSGLDYTILKCGVIYGKGDHLLDHLSHAFYTFPIFAFVGFKDKPTRPSAVEDVAQIVKVTLTELALSRRTVAVVGPEQLTLREAVRRVAGIVGKRPVMLPMPVWFHYILAWLAEGMMTIPLVSLAQVRMLVEGLAEPLPPCSTLPAELAPQTRFTDEQIRKGLPAAGPFGRADIRCCRKVERLRQLPVRHAFFEMP